MTTGYTIGGVTVVTEPTDGMTPTQRVSSADGKYLGRVRRMRRGWQFCSGYTGDWHDARTKREALTEIVREAFHRGWLIP